MNHVVIPVYLATVVTAVITGICLMTVDERRYTVVFIVLLGIALLLTAALLISIPLIRKKEALIESAKYDFDFQSVEKKENYTFEQRILIGVADAAPSPFGDSINSTVEVKGADKLEEILSSYNIYEIAPVEFSDEINKYVSDLTYECEFTTYEIEKANDGKINIYEKSCLSFTGECVYVNDEKFPYSDINATVNSASVLNQVKLSVIFEFSDHLCAVARLDKNIISILKQFNINVTNSGALNLILSDKIKAFEQILKYGKIKKY